MHKIVLLFAALALIGCGAPAPADAPLGQSQSQLLGGRALTADLEWLVGLSETELAATFEQGSAGEVPLGRNRGVVLAPRHNWLTRLVAGVYDGSTWRMRRDGTVSVRDTFGGSAFFVADAHAGTIEDFGVRRPHWISPYRQSISTDGRPSLFIDYGRDPTPLVNRILDEVRAVDPVNRPGLYLGRAHFEDPWFGGSYLYYFAADFQA